MAMPGFTFLLCLFLALGLTAPKTFSIPAGGHTKSPEQVAKEKADREIREAARQERLKNPDAYCKSSMTEFEFEQKPSVRKNFDSDADFKAHASYETADTLYSPRVLIPGRAATRSQAAVSEQKVYYEFSKAALSRLAEILIACRAENPTKPSNFEKTAQAWLSRHVQWASQSKWQAGLDHFVQLSALVEALPGLNQKDILEGLKEQVRFQTESIKGQPAKLSPKLKTVVMEIRQKQIDGKELTPAETLLAKLLIDFQVKGTSLLEHLAGPQMLYLAHLYIFGESPAKAHVSEGVRIQPPPDEAGKQPKLMALMKRINDTLKSAETPTNSRNLHLNDLLEEEIASLPPADRSAFRSRWLHDELNKIGEEIRTTPTGNVAEMTRLLSAQRALLKMQVMAEAVQTKKAQEHGYQGAIPVDKDFYQNPLYVGVELQQLALERKGFEENKPHTEIDSMDYVMSKIADRLGMDLPSDIRMRLRSLNLFEQEALSRMLDESTRMRPERDKMKEALRKLIYDGVRPHDFVKLAQEFPAYREQLARAIDSGIQAHLSGDKKSPISPLYRESMLEALLSGDKAKLNDLLNENGEKLRNSVASAILDLDAQQKKQGSSREGDLLNRRKAALATFLGLLDGRGHKMQELDAAYIKTVQDPSGQVYQQIEDRFDPDKVVKSLLEEGVARAAYQKASGHDDKAIDAAVSAFLRPSRHVDYDAETIGIPPLARSKLYETLRSEPHRMMFESLSALLHSRGWDDVIRQLALNPTPENIEEASKKWDPDYHKYITRYHRTDELTQKLESEFAKGKELSTEAQAALEELAAIEYAKAAGVAQDHLLTKAELDALWAQHPTELAALVEKKKIELGLKVAERAYLAGKPDEAKRLADFHLGKGAGNDALLKGFEDKRKVAGTVATHLADFAKDHPLKSDDYDTTPAARNYKERKKEITKRYELEQARLAADLQEANQWLYQKSIAVAVAQEEHDTHKKWYDLTQDERIRQLSELEDKVATALTKLKAATTEKERLELEAKWKAAKAEHEFKKGLSAIPPAERPKKLKELAEKLKFAEEAHKNGTQFLADAKKAYNEGNTQLAQMMERRTQELVVGETEARKAFQKLTAETTHKYATDFVEKHLKGDYENAGTDQEKKARKDQLISTVEKMLSDLQSQKTQERVLVQAQKKTPGMAVASLNEFSALPYERYIAKASDPTNGLRYARSGLTQSLEAAAEKAHEGHLASEAALKDTLDKLAKLGINVKGGVLSDFDKAELSLKGMWKAFGEGYKGDFAQTMASLEKFGVSPNRSHDNPMDALRSDAMRKWVEEGAFTNFEFNDKTAAGFYLTKDKDGKITGYQLVFRDLETAREGAKYALENLQRRASAVGQTAIKHGTLENAMIETLHYPAAGFASWTGFNGVEINSKTGEWKIRQEKFQIPETDATRAFHHAQKAVTESFENLRNWGGIRVMEKGKPVGTAFQLAANYQYANKPSVDAAIKQGEELYRESLNASNEMALAAVATVVAAPLLATAEAALAARIAQLAKAAEAGLLTQRGMMGLEAAQIALRGAQMGQTGITEFWKWAAFPTAFQLGQHAISKANYEIRTALGDRYLDNPQLPPAYAMWKSARASGIFGAVMGPVHGGLSRLGVHDYFGQLAGVFAADVIDGQIEVMNGNKTQAQVFQDSAKSTLHMAPTFGWIYTGGKWLNRVPGLSMASKHHLITGATLAFNTATGSTFEYLENPEAFNLADSLKRGVPQHAYFASMMATHSQMLDVRDTILKEKLSFQEAKAKFGELGEQVYIGMIHVGDVKDGVSFYMKEPTAPVEGMPRLSGPVDPNAKPVEPKPELRATWDATDGKLLTTYGELAGFTHPEDFPLALHLYGNPQGVGTGWLGKLTSGFQAHLRANTPMGEALPDIRANYVKTLREGFLANADPARQSNPTAAFIASRPEISAPIKVGEINPENASHMEMVGKFAEFATPGHEPEYYKYFQAWVDDLYHDGRVKGNLGQATTLFAEAWRRGHKFDLSQEAYEKYFGEKPAAPQHSGPRAIPKAQPLRLEGPR